MSAFRAKLFSVVTAIMVFSAPINMGMNSLNASALSSNFIDMYSQNDILFYNPEEDCDEVNDATRTTCVAPTGDQITWIGDSLTALGGQDRFEEFFPGADFGVNFNGTSIDDYIRSGKTINTDFGGVAGLTILDNIIEQGKLRPVLVFALGGNSTWDTCGYGGKSCMDYLMDAVGSDVQVLVLTTKVIEPHPAANGGFDGNNSYLKKQDEKYSNLTVADWAAEVKDEYYIRDGLHYTGDGYSAYYQFIKDNLPKACSSSATLLPGDTREEKIWNWFVRANIPGVSDNPAAIAGIMGNFFGEQNYFVLNYNCVNGACGRGLFALLDSVGGGELGQLVNDAIGRDAWKDYSSRMNWDIDNYPTNLTADKTEAADGITESEIDKIIDVELKYFINDNPRFNGSGNGWAREYSFMGNIDNVDNKNSPESYSDLFLVAVEGAYPGGTDAILDSKVKAMAERAGWSGDYWQGASQRRGFAKKIYERLANADTGGSWSSSTGGGDAIANEAIKLSWGYGEKLYDGGMTNRITGNGVGSAVEAYQEAARKYGVDASISCSLLVYLAIRESVEPNFMDGEPVDSALIEEHMRKDTTNWQPVTASSVSDLLPGDVLINYTPDAHSYLYVGNNRIAEAMWMSDTNPGFPPTVMDWHWGNVTDYGTKIYRYRGTSGVTQTKEMEFCKASNGKSAKGTGKIAEIAALMSWPVQNWQTGADDFSTDRIGKCNGGRSGWIQYVFNSGDCMSVPRQFYKDNSTKGGWGEMDCGTFVSSVLYYLGLVDLQLVGGGQPGMAGHFARLEDWTEISNDGTESNLRPGDVLWNTSHVVIYVGEKYGGDYGHIAHASARTRVGEVGPYYDNGWRIFRYTGNKLGSDETDGWTSTEYENWPEFMKGYVNEASKQEDCYENICFGDQGNRVGGLNNCSAFSSWFVKRYTGIDFGLYNGNETAKAFSNATGEPIKEGFDRENGQWPKVFSVFSQIDNGVIEGVPYGHTGVVLGVDFDNEIITVAEASYGRFSWSNGLNDPQPVGGRLFPGVNQYTFDEFVAPGVEFVSTADYLTDTPR